MLCLYTRNTRSVRSSDAKKPRESRLEESLWEQMFFLRSREVYGRSTSLMFLRFFATLLVLHEPSATAELGHILLLLI